MKIAELIPWDLFENLYSKLFDNKPDHGRPTYASKIAFGIIYIKEQKNLTDERNIKYIAESPYIQSSHRHIEVRRAG